MVSLPGLAHFAVVAAAFVALAVWTWGGWPDVLMDFGRELYVAWRVSEGEVLYRDVASFYGPLSPYVNGGWCRVFGVSLRTLALANLAILGAAVALLWAIVRKGTAGGRTAPTTGVLVFLPVCGFAQLVHAGSFNFVAPYSHEATHGFVLAAAAVLSSIRVLETGRPVWAAASGVFVGLSFLTKPESFVAAAVASAATLLLAWVRPDHRADRPSSLAAFAGGVVLPPTIAFVLLLTAMPAPEAWKGLLGSWAYLNRAELNRNPYFAWSTGTSDVSGNLAALGRAAGVQLAVAVPAVALAFLAGRRRRLGRPLAVTAALLVLLALAPTWQSDRWLQVARPLPLWAVVAAAGSAWKSWRNAHDPALFTRHGARFALAAFALFLLPRIFLHGRLYHYGFVLAVPAVLLVVAALVDWIPAALERRGGSGSVFRSAALAALAVAVAFHVGATYRWLAAKQTFVGEGPDRFRADLRGAYVNAAMQGIAGLARGGDTLVVLPEGVMINYLLRMRSSVPYLTMLPSDVATFGEQTFVESLQLRPPSLIVLVHRDTSEFGARLFGSDYGLRVADWISAHYVRVGGAGDPALHPGSTFGVTALRLRTLPAGQR
jgi:hypothetical protein